MNKIWTGIRSVLAVIAGVVAMTALAFAIEIPLRSLALRFLNFPSREALETSIGWMFSQTFYTLPALALGGYIAAWLAPRRPFAHAVALAILQEILIVALIF